MAKIVALTGVALVVAGLAAASEAAVVRGSFWRNSLKPRGAAAGEITLATGGRTDYVIVRPEVPTPQESKAVEELAHWLGEMTGAAFPVVSDEAAQGPREISVGLTTRARRAGLPQVALGREGYAIDAVGERLFLRGGDGRGAINAVFALLEEDLGCRWYAPGAARIPRRPTVVFRPVPRSFTPRLMIRDPYYRAAFDGEWSLRNRTNAPEAPVAEELGGHVTYALFVHTFHSLVPPGEYFEEHPEYFMLDENGNRNAHQLCTTNPDVIRIATESARRILRDKPGAKVISVSKTDGGRSCVCENCKAIDDAEGTNAGSLLFLVNKVAEALEDEFPDVTVSTLAYLETVKPPKTMRPRRNVAIRLCTDNCMWSHPFTPARQSPQFSPMLESWSAIHDQIHIWDYCVNFSHYTAPMPNMDVIADNIRYFVENNATGIMAQGAYQSLGTERDAMRSWVIGKLLWDPSLDVGELMRDFIYGYFGKAGPAIAEYNELLREAGREHAESLAAPAGGIRYAMDHEFLSKEFIDRASELYDRAEQMAGTDAIRERVERDRLPIMYVKLCRGPEFVGEGYDELIDRFGAIARRVGLTHIYEGPPDLDAKLAAWREAAQAR